LSILEGLPNDVLKAVRIAFAEQIGDKIDADLKKDFVKFYQKEVLKARDLQLTLVRKKIKDNGDIQMKASDKFISVMQDYFVQVTEDGGSGSNGKNM